MARPKKKIQKREKVFNFISDVIDLIQDRWKIPIFLMSVIIYFYVVLRIDTLAEILHEMRYM